MNTKSDVPSQVGQHSDSGCTAIPRRSHSEISADICMDQRESGLSWRTKMRIPLASFVQAFALTSVVFAPNIYISLFKGNAMLIGLANIMVVPLDITINPLLGRLSDAGFFNRGFCADVDSWGRRAPLFLAALPICVMSTVAAWVGPESLGSPLAVALWYTAIRFLLTLGTAMFEVSFQAAFTELFPSKAERVSLGLAKFLFGLLGGGCGSVGIGASALGVKNPGSTQQRLVFGLFGSLTGCAWIMAVPYALLQRRSLMKKVVSGHSSVWEGTWELWRSSAAFRCFAISTHLYSAAFALTLTGLPFYFEAALRFSPEEVELAMRVVLIGAGTMIPISLPFVNWLSNRMDPSKMAGLGGVFCIIISICHAHASFVIDGKFWPQVGQISLICGAGVGVLSVSWTSAQSALFTWIVDEDQVRRAELDGVLDKSEFSATDIPARRDGMINSFKTCFSISGVAWAGVLHLLLGCTGYDGDRYSKGEPQPEEVRVLLDTLFVVVVPAMFIIFAIPMLLFPLRGERLLALTTKYSKLYDKLSSEIATTGLG